MNDALAKLRSAFGSRFSDPPRTMDSDEGMETLAGMAARGACREFEARPVDGSLVRLLCAVALSSPTKSDLQQRDILRISDPKMRSAVNRLETQQSEQLQRLAQQADVAGGSEASAQAAVRARRARMARVPAATARIALRR